MTLDKNSGDYKSAYEDFLEGADEMTSNFEPEQYPDEVAAFAETALPGWELRSPGNGSPDGLYVRVKGKGVSEEDAQALYDEWARIFKDEAWMDLLWEGRSGGWMGVAMNDVARLIRVDGYLESKKEFDYVVHDTDEDDLTPDYWFYAGRDAAEEELYSLETHGNLHKFFEIDSQARSVMMKFKDAVESYGRG